MTILIRSGEPKFIEKSLDWYYDIISEIEESEKVPYLYNYGEEIVMTVIEDIKELNTVKYLQIVRDIEYVREQLATTSSNQWWWCYPRAYISIEVLEAAVKAYKTASRNMDTGVTLYCSTALKLTNAISTSMSKKPIPDIVVLCVSQVGKKDCLIVNDLKKDPL